MSPRPLVAAAVAVMLAASTPASGQEPALAERSRLRVEASGGLDAPLGMAGLAFVVRATPWLSAGGGGGFIQQAGSAWLRSAIFARAHLVQVGRFTMGPIVWASFGNRAREETYRRPQYAADDLRWTWSHALRLDAGLGAETRFASGVTARLEGGVGYVFGTPTCTYAAHDQAIVPPFTGACDAPEIPVYYHFAREPGRITPHLGLAVGFEPRPLTFAWRTTPPMPPAPPVLPPPGVAEDPRASVAWVAPTALVAPKGAVTATLLLASRTPLLGVTAGLLDRLELTAAVGPLSHSDRPDDILWAAWLKGEVVARGPAHLALVAGGIGAEPGQRSYTASSARFGAAGPVGSLCLGDACRSLFSVSVLAGVAAFRDQDASVRGGFGALISSSVTVGLWRHLKIVGELHSVTADVPAIWVVVLRVPFPHVAVDAGVARGFPVGSVSVRF